MIITHLQRDLYIYISHCELKSPFNKHEFTRVPSHRIIFPKMAPIMAEITKQQSNGQMFVAKNVRLALVRTVVRIYLKM